mmetsp:Transcript_40509/g.39012  ORF Transcript_40509/g.39012 Transcript_40509/m.39012 type:complete len:259 (+) Transcript_40509:905-1681(+)
MLFRHLVLERLDGFILPDLTALVPAVFLTEMDSFQPTSAEVSEIIRVRVILPLQASTSSLAGPPLILILLVLSHAVRLGVALEEDPPAADVGLVHDRLVQMFLVQELYVGQLPILNAQVMRHIPFFLLHSHELVVLDRHIVRVVEDQVVLLGNHFAEVLGSLHLLGALIPLRLLGVVGLVLIVLVHLYFEVLDLLLGDAGLDETPLFELLLDFGLLGLLDLLLLRLLPHLRPRHLRQIPRMVPPAHRIRLLDLGELGL